MTSSSSGDGPEEGDPALDAGEGPAADAADAADAVDDAAADALRRARAGAVAKGLRPGSRPRARVRRPGPGASGSSSVRSRTVGAPDRDPALLGEQVERIVGDRGWGDDVAVGQVMGRWAEIVGRDVAAHAEPVTFEAGVLTVRADSTAWATQMRMLASTVLTRIEAAVGPGVVAELRVHGPSAPSWSRGPRRTHGGRGPRDTYG